MANKVSVVIPAFNEGSRISNVLNELIPYGHEVIVVDDGSTDDTAEISRNLGVKVVRQKNSGYINAIKNGFKHANGDICVTLDADGEHDPKDISKLIGPILANKADIVLGKRHHIPRVSERFISWITSFKIPIHDTGTGLRAIRKDIALNLNIPGKCICGVSVLEYYHMGARIIEVPIAIRSISKVRKIAWGHFIQLFYVIKLLFKKN